MKKNTLKILLVFALVLFSLVCLFGERAEASLLTGKPKTWPEQCRVGETIKITYTTGGLGNGAYADLTLTSVAEQGKTEPYVEVYTERVSEESSGTSTFSYTVGKEAGKTLCFRMLYYEDGDFSGTSTPIYIPVLDGTALPVFDTLNLGKSGWVDIGSKRYYGDANGIAVIGEQKIDGKTYCFDGTGVLQTGWFKNHNYRWRYANADGAYPDMREMKTLYIPSYVDYFDAKILFGVTKDFYIQCEPGSYAEWFAQYYCMQYDNGVRKVIGSNITDENEKIRWIVANYITPDMSDEKKIRTLYRWLQTNATYDHTRTEASREGVLIKGYGVCQSSALAYCALLREVGIENKYISGVYKPTGEGHAWTLVRLNGQWYHTNPVGNVSGDRKVVFSSGDDYALRFQTDSDMGKYYTWSQDEIITDKNQVGWVTMKDGTKYYYDGRAENGGRVTGIAIIDSNEYVFDEEGRLLGENGQEGKIKAFVTRCYEVIQGRSPDAGGLEYWVTKLKAKTKTAAEIVYEFITSNEFKAKNYSAQQVIEILYRSMQGREPDEGGMNYWLGKVQNGGTYADLVNGFCTSNEFKNICANYDINPGSVTAAGDESRPAVNVDTTQVRAFLSRCYLLMQKREPDAGGLDYWTNAIVKGKTAAEVVYEFINSNEFRARHLPNREIAEILYLTALNRAPEEEGMTYWLNRFDRGDTIAAIVNGFCESNEFKRICAAYGITPGAVKASDDNVKGVSTAARTQTEEARETRQMNEGKIKAFVRRTYAAALGREPGDVEAEYWVWQLKELKIAPADAAKGILTSNEFRGRGIGGEQLIRILYRVYADREADEAGLAFWLEKLNAGTSQEELMDGFAASSEFKNIVRSFWE